MGPSVPRFPWQLRRRAAPWVMHPRGRFLTVPEWLRRVRRSTQGKAFGAGLKCAGCAVLLVVPSYQAVEHHDLVGRFLKRWFFTAPQAMVGWAAVAAVLSVLAGYRVAMSWYPRQGRKTAGAIAAIIAGVYALTNLADDWEAGRQQCIDIFCARLRLPGTHHDQEDPTRRVSTRSSAVPFTGGMG